MTRRSRIALAALILVGTAFRLSSPGRISLWRDEVQALNISSLPDLTAINRFLYLHESHPPLFYYLEHFVGRWTGNATAGIGLIVLLASIALIPAVWWLAALSRVRGAAVAAAALVAGSVPLSFFSVQLRPYSLFSLAMVTGTAAILQDRARPAFRWRVLWAGTSLALIYLHHAGAIVVIGQILALLLFFRPDVGWLVHVRRWAPFLGAVALGAAPDLVMLVHQNSVAPYAVPHPVRVLRPIGELWGLAIAFPGEIGLAIGGATACLLTRHWSVRPDNTGQVSAAPARFAAALFPVLAGLLALASYRSNLLVPYLVMSTAPLGTVAAGIAIANAAGLVQRWPSVIYAEVAVACLALSGAAFVGNGKTDTDLLARYISAEAQPDDLIILAPGALGPSFNRFFRGNQSQIDFPVQGRVTRYEFDNDFDRAASLSALSATADSIAAACRAGRRVWLVTPMKWIIPGEPPTVLDAWKFGGLGQADAARANLLERRLRRTFGVAPHVIRSGSAGAGVEFLEARLWGAGGAMHTPERRATCDAN